MMALLSGAWWAQRLASAGVMAAIAAAAAGVIVVGLGIGLWWVRADAAADERGRCIIEQATAQRAADAEAATRVRLSERVARDERERLLLDLDLARKRAAELEDVLAATKPAGMCWPRDVARKLNETRRQLK